MTIMHDEPALITAVIAERLSCLRCIAARTKLTLEAAESALTVIRRAVDVHHDDAGTCGWCRTTTAVVWIERSGSGTQRLA